MQYKCTCELGKLLFPLCSTLPCCYTQRENLTPLWLIFSNHTCIWLSRINTGLHDQRFKILLPNQKDMIEIFGISKKGDFEIPKVLNRNFSAVPDWCGFSNCAVD